LRPEKARRDSGGRLNGRVVAAVQGRPLDDSGRGLRRRKKKGECADDVVMGNGVGYGDQSLAPGNITVFPKRTLGKQCKKKETQRVDGGEWIGC
jgi:hypothetical protein